MNNTTLEHGKSEAANFDPANYTYVTTGYNGHSEDSYEYASDLVDDLEAHAGARAEAVNQQPYSGLNRVGHGGKCLHCGANLKWFCLFRDIRTGLLVTTGTTCAQELGLPDKGALVRKQLAERIERATKLAKIDARFPGLRQELDRVVTEQNRAYFHQLLDDVSWKLNHYCDLSDRQAEVAKRFLNQGLDRIEERARKEAAEGPAQPIPAQWLGARVLIRGTVLGTKEIESDQFGVQHKMLVKTEAGCKLWGSNPGYGQFDKGEAVQFSAKIEASKDDPCFGFFSRPTKYQLIEVNE